MQTTLRMDDELLRRAKAVAASNGETLTAFIEEALRIRLEARELASQTERHLIPIASGHDGLQFGVDLDDNAGLLDAMDE